MKSHRHYGTAYILSFFVYPLMFAVLDRVNAFAAAVSAVLALGYQIGYVAVLRKRENVSGSKAVTQGFKAAIGALSVIIVVMYADFFIMGMSTRNITTGEKNMVFGFDIFKVHGYDMAMNIFFITVFTVCIALEICMALGGRKQKKASALVKNSQIVTA